MDDSSLSVPLGSLREVGYGFVWLAEVLRAIGCEAAW